MNTATVTVFVRHSADCRHAREPSGEGTGEFFRSCKCRKWLRYSLNGVQYRHTCKTRVWAEAEKQMRQLSAKLNGDPLATTPSGSQGKTIATMVVEYVGKKHGKGVSANTVKKYEGELGRFQEFMAQRMKFVPSDIGDADLIDYRNSWEKPYGRIRKSKTGQVRIGTVLTSPLTRQKTQERLRGFLKYMKVDYSNALDAIKIPAKHHKVKWFTDEEYSRVVAAVPGVFADAAKARKITALIELMRNTGLAIQDACTLEKDRLQGTKGNHRIATYRQKTGGFVSVLITDEFADKLRVVLNGNQKYFFWNTGTGKKKTVTTNFQHDLRSVFHAAGFKESGKGNPHSLRHTFAVSCLGKGMSMQTLSLLLGHSSIKTTEKYYASFSAQRQAILDNEMRAMWAS